MIHWRRIQKESFTSINLLLKFLQLDSKKIEKVNLTPKFILNLPLRLAEKIEKNNLEDPLFRQFVPLKEEEIVSRGYCFDPVGDIESRKSSKFLQKYKGRALLLCTSSCAMHCRFCFRQKYPYEKEQKGFAEEMALIAKDHLLEEIILSGGDPLSLSDEILGHLINEISRIPHVKRIRFHSRFPIGIPERMDDSFLKILESSKKQIIFVVHVNHPREIDQDVAGSLKKIQKLGIPVLSQSVLLKGVNDDFLTLKTLFESLCNEGVMPYYLHQFDRVQGMAHFEVEQTKGMALLEKLRAHLPGYAIPQYAKEVAGADSKHLISSSFPTVFDPPIPALHP